MIRWVVSELMNGVLSWKMLWDSGSRSDGVGGQWSMFDVDVSDE